MHATVRSINGHGLETDCIEKKPIKVLHTALHARIFVYGCTLTIK